MKAKDYTKRFNKELSYDAIAHVVANVIADMVGETSTIGTQRKCQTVEAWRAVITEQDAKWKALCRILEREFGYPVLNYNGFMEALHLHGQELFDIIGEM